MQTTRILSSTENLPPEMTAQYGALLDTAFKVEGDFSYLGDFPIWDPRRETQAMRLTLESHGKLIATAGIRFCEIRGVSGNIRAGLIGAVATDPQYQGQGHASKLIAGLIENSKKRGCDALFLWGGEHRLYQKYGFQLCGTQFRLPLTQLNPNSFELSAPQFGFKHWFLDSMSTRNSGVKRSDEDLDWIEAHQNVIWMSNEEAFIGCGRGIDLKRMVHEWGGSPAQVRILLAQAQKLKIADELLTSKQEAAKLGFSTEGVDPEYLCMAKLLNRRAVFRAFSSKPDGFEVVETSAQETLFLRKGRHPVLLDESETANFLFGPRTDSVDPEFPAPLWFYGLDAV